MADQHIHVEYHLYGSHYCHKQRQPLLFSPQLPNAPQQRHLLALSPRLRHYGGCACVCRR